MVRVFIESTGETREFKHINTVMQLLGRLGYKHTDVLVIRGRELLTQDRTIGYEADIRIRHVVSRG